MSAYDVIVIGAGSVGLPTAMFLAKEKLKVLVIESHASCGQGENKAAIGGVRATHSNPAKIKLCLESLRIFSSWADVHGGSVGWKTGGYCFPVFREAEETVLKSILPMQKQLGLNIDWVDAEAIAEIIPGVNEAGLLGGTYSPEDGQVSPLMAAYEMHRVAESLGCEFRFGENVQAITTDKQRASGVITDKGNYVAPIVVIAAGPYANELGKSLGLEIPVAPDSHEAGISAPFEPFLKPLVVDLRPGPDGRSSNFYFGQNEHGAVIFCYTPSTLFVGTDHRCTSEFAPSIAQRLIDLIPRLRNLLVRRLWRGLYPMTPDGFPIVGAVEEVPGLYLAVGMCGHGFMLGPGVGANLASLIVHGKPLIDPDVFNSLSFSRDFYAGKEALK
ncbi:MAG: FAD-binding oxidoreductase [Candidatus Coatesbacteria bacterium]|nr:FAD-binding oxidoreductase [Candidatus Coatesbacteria bacterium]